jgi:hypothetical protein
MGRNRAISTIPTTARMKFFARNIFALGEEGKA